jgi:hypothetical protein
MTVSEFKEARLIMAEIACLDTHLVAVENISRPEERVKMFLTRDNGLGVLLDLAHIPWGYDSFIVGYTTNLYDTRNLLYDRLGRIGGFTPAAPDPLGAQEIPFPPAPSDEDLSF